MSTHDPRSYPSFSGAFPQNSCYHTGHFRFSQPQRSGGRRIEQSVRRGERRSPGSPKVGYNSDGE